MHIAGGLYRETCMIPEWDYDYGSGVRAAAAVSQMSPKSVLHTYINSSDSPSISYLEALGVSVNGRASTASISVSYFHPLSRPFIYPPRSDIPPQPTLYVSADVVLRFGFLEGDAVVEASRAVFDPQAPADPVTFEANGSVADHLAIVLNVQELRVLTGEYQLRTAASRLMQVSDVSVIVAKAGPSGCTVFERNVEPVQIPAYRSSRVFKIGSGDVFSAMFAHFWAEAQIAAPRAADLASRSVASFCSSHRLPVSPESISHLIPAGHMAPGPVVVEGDIETLPGRYILEEACYLLREFGLAVFTLPPRDLINCQMLNEVSAVLVLLPGNTQRLEWLSTEVLDKEMPTVVLSEAASCLASREWSGPNITVVNDFVSALYFVFWAAIPAENSHP